MSYIDDFYYRNNIGDTIKSLASGRGTGSSGRSGSSGNSSSGGGSGGGVWGAAASVLNTTITSIFKTSGDKARKEQEYAKVDQIKAQTARINQDARSALLTDAQKNELALKMLDAKTETERLKILNDNITTIQKSGIDGIAAVKVAQAKAAADATSAKSNSILMLVGVGTAALLLTAILIKPKD